MTVYMLSCFPIVVIDTNVIYQGLKGANGASNYILHLLREQKISIAYYQLIN